MSDYLDYQDQIFNEIGTRFGLSATTLDPLNRRSRTGRKPITVAQCQRLLYRYGFEKGKEISKRHGILMDKWIEAHQ